MRPDVGTLSLVWPRIFLRLSPYYLSAMWQMVGKLAEPERSLIQERTKAGRAAAVARGVKMGRKPLLSAQQAIHARKLIQQRESPGHVAKSLKVARRTLYRVLAAASLCQVG